jgi:hypothetical protein
MTTNSHQHPWCHLLEDYLQLFITSKFGFTHERLSFNFFIIITFGFYSWLVCTNALKASLLMQGAIARNWFIPLKPYPPTK